LVCAVKSRQELIEAQQRVEAVYAEAKQELTQIPGVTDVGIGIKEVAGELTGETVLRVYVEAKRDESELPPDQIVPKEFQGIKTDVILFRETFPEEDTTRYRPVKGGVQIGAAGSSGVGTLGCLARLTADNAIVVLSNHHVLYDSPATDNSEIGQPDYTSSCCCSCGDIATNVHGIRHDHLDCAIAKLKSGVEHSTVVHGIGNITGVADAVAGEAVKKRGRTTELTTGTVTNLTKDAANTKILEVEVKKNNGNERFTRPGDSGSALLNANDEIIGLHKTGNNGDDVTPGNFVSTSIGIQEVLDAFDADGFPISILTGPQGGESAVRTAAPALDTLAGFEQRLRSTEEGRRVLELYDLHHREIVELVNQERAVTVVWHRKQGPAWLAAFARSLKHPGYTIPQEIEGIDRRDALMGLGDAFRRSASPDLLAAIDVHADDILRLATECDTVDALLQSLPTVDSLGRRAAAGVG
jgi:hypothetical protein